MQYGTGPPEALDIAGWLVDKRFQQRLFDGCLAMSRIEFSHDCIESTMQDGYGVSSHCGMPHGFSSL